MKINGLASVLLNMSDLERSRRFYGDLLGLPQLGEPDDHVIVLGAGPVALVLHAHGELGCARVPGPEDPGAVLLFLDTDDVDAAVTELRTAGVTITAEPTDQPWGERTATILDPDNHSIMLSHPTTPESRKQSRSTRRLLRMSLPAHTIRTWLDRQSRRVRSSPSTTASAFSTNKSDGGTRTTQSRQWSLALQA